MGLAAVAISVCVMILGVGITRGYQKEISKRFFSCWGHIHVTNFLTDPNTLLNDEKIVIDTALVAKLKLVPEVRRVSPYRIQSALAKSKEEIDGVILKGYKSNEDFEHINSFVMEGKGISISNDSTYSNEILISNRLADRLKLKLGASFLLYFVQKDSQQPKARKVVIQGIYNTGLEDFDKTFLLCDDRLISSVNDDSFHVTQGYELSLSNANKIQETADYIYKELLTAPLQAYTLQERFSSIFSWLDLMKMNEKIIISFMIIIALINMISVLLILILERTTMIGVAKALGMPNFSIQKIFIYLSAYLVLGGCLLGTFIAIVIAWIQRYFGLVTLDEATYYIKQVPVDLNPLHISIINLGTIICCTVILVIPSFLVRRISPIKAIRLQ